MACHSLLLESRMPRTESSSATFPGHLDFHCMSSDISLLGAGLGLAQSGPGSPSSLAPQYIFFFVYFQNDILHNLELGMLTYLDVNLGVNLEFLYPNIYSRAFCLFGLSCEIIVFWLSAKSIRANYNLHVVWPKFKLPICSLKFDILLLEISSVRVL